MSNPFPPDPQTFCEAYWRGKSRLFALALYEGFIHFWEPDSLEQLELQEPLEEWVWVVAEEVKISNNATVNSNFLRSVFKPALSRGIVGRLLLLSNNRAVFLDANGHGEVGFINRNAAPSERWMPFRFQAREDFYHLPASYWLEKMKDWQREEENDFAFALDWLELPSAERARRILCVSRGDWDEMEQIARLVLKLEYQAGWESDDEYGMCAWIVQRGDLFSWRLDSEDADVSYDYPANLEALWDTWFGFFSPSLDYNFLEQHIAAKQEPPVYLPFHLSHPFTELSAHEQLEVRLQLRDWLSERAQLPPERIAELLS